MLSPQEMLDHPHVQAIGFHERVDYPGLAHPAPLVGFPVEMSATPGRIRHRAPTLGEHTDEILTELGYSAEEISELHSTRVV